MTEYELWEALDGLFAYDDGCTDSGIHDERLRDRCIRDLKDRRDSLGTTAYAAWLAKFVRDRWLGDDAIDMGYGLEDIKSFIDWLDYKMDALA